MKMLNKKRWAAMLAALLMCVLLCSGTVFAEEVGTETNETVSESEDDTFHVPLFDQLEGGNKVSTTLFIAGGALIIVGAVGIICLVVWQKADKRRNRMEEDREDIFDEIEQAELRNRKMQEAQRRAGRAQVNRHPEYAPHPTAETAYPKERPLVPSTPVSMQPGAVPRTRVQETAQAAAPVVPVTVQPKPAVQSASKPAAAVKPVVRQQTQPAAASKQAAKPKYDLDDILREVRESKNQ